VDTPAAHDGFDAAQRRIGSQAMNEQANEQIVREIYAAFMRSDIPALLSRLTDDVVWQVPGELDNPVAGERRSIDEVADFFKALDDLEEPLKFETREFLTCGDKVAVLGHYRWLIKTTDRIAECDFAHVFTMRDGRVVKFQEYTDTAAFAEAYRPALADIR
jgi:ketosteroid isomerase-like protein